MPETGGKAVTPTARTLKHLRADGWIADRVDCTNRHASRDYLGIIDVIALRGEEILAIQVTGGGNGPARVRKMERDEYAEGMAAMRKAGIGIEVWDWRKRASGQWHIWKRDLS